MKHQDDLDPDFYGPKPDAEKAAAIGCLLFLACIGMAMAYAAGRMLWHYLHQFSW